MKKRLITGAIMFAILLPLILIDHVICEIGFAVVAVFISVVGTFEYMRAASTKSSLLKPYRFIIPVFSGIITFTALSATYNASSENNYIYHIYTLFAYLFFVIVILLMMIFTKTKSGSEESEKKCSDAFDIGSCIIGITYSGLMLGYTLSLRYFEPERINQTIISLTGWKSFLYVYTIVILTDSFAFSIGRRWGKHKLCPDISPNKSVEGAIAGLVGGIVFGVVSLYLYNIINTTEHMFLVIVIGGVASGVISCAVQIGDLIESKLKRTYEVKDFGNILPGHGGILDRFDSLLYSGIIFFLVMNFIEIVVLA